MGKSVNEIYAEFDKKKEARKQLFQSIFKKIKIGITVLIIAYLAYKFFSGELTFSKVDGGAKVTVHMTNDAENQEAIRLRAQEGDVLSQTQLGFMYMEGTGLEQDYNQAIHWLTKAATSGNADAQEALGYMHLHKLGGLDDNEQALHWYTLSAKQGKVSAQFNLALAYKDGLIQQDYEKAFIWFKKAAEQGDSEAQLQLGLLLANGRGVEEDVKKAVYWILKSAKQGNEEAQEIINSIQAANAQSK